MAGNVERGVSELGRRFNWGVVAVDGERGGLRKEVGVIGLGVEWMISLISLGKVVVCDIFVVVCDFVKIVRCVMLSYTYIRY